MCQAMLEARVWWWLHQGTPFSFVGFLFDFSLSSLKKENKENNGNEINVSKKKFRFVTKGVKATSQIVWFSAATLDDVFNIFQQYAGSAIMLVVGNTSTGIYKVPMPHLYFLIQSLSLTSPPIERASRCLLRHSWHSSTHHSFCRSS